MPRRSILLFAGACIAIAASLATVTVIVVTSRDRAQAVAQGTATGQPSVGGPFQLVNQEGQAVDETLLNGKWSLVFFGFTYCPDICPNEMMRMTQILKVSAVRVVRETCFAARRWRSALTLRPPSDSGVAGGHKG